MLQRRSKGGTGTQTNHRRANHLAQTPKPTTDAQTTSGSHAPAWEPAPDAPASTCCTLERALVVTTLERALAVPTLEHGNERKIDDLLDRNNPL